MPDDQDTSGVAGPVHPPPQPPPPSRRPLFFVGVAVAFQAATVLSLLLDRCDWATILAILALIFGGVAFIMMLRPQDDQDTSGVAGPVHPPPN